MKKWKTPKYPMRIVFDGRGNIYTHLKGNPIFDRLKLEWINFRNPQYHTSLAEPIGSGNWIHRWGVFDFSRGRWPYISKRANKSEVKDE
jgi:hypothetical protein